MYILRIILKQNPFHLFLIIIVILLTRLIYLYPSILLGNIIDAINTNQYALITNKLLLIIIIAVISAVTLPIINFFISVFIQKIIKAFSIDTMTSLFKKNYGFFQTANVGSIISKIERGIFTLESFLISLFSSIIPSIISIVLIGLYFTLSSGIYLISILIIGVLCYIIFSVLIIHKRKTFIEEVNDIEDDLADMIGESITAGKSIKSYGKVYSMLSMFHTMFQKYANKTSRLSFVSTSLSSGLEMISLITSASIIFVGIILITKNYHLSSGTFVILFSYAGIFMNNIKNIMLVYKNYLELKSDQYQLFELLKAEPYKTSAQNHVISESIVHISVQAIQISIDNKTILHLKKELSLLPNASIGIVGKTGRGKTTLLEIIAGLTQKKDCVSINNIDIYQLSAEYITNTICYIPQQVQFLSGTLNRAVFFEDAEIQDMPRIVSLMNDLHLEKFVPFVLEKMDIPIKTLSGGERKRFALMRALVSPAQVIILDEPTSELDDKTKDMVWEIIKTHTKDKILICATHDKPEKVFDSIVHL